MGNEEKVILRTDQQEMLHHAPAGEVKKAIGNSFFRGEACNFLPYKSDYPNPEFLEKFLLKGWVPEVPFLDKETRITAFGSCFAAHLTRHLGSVGYNLSKDRDPAIYISMMGEGLVNTYALLSQLEWALENVPPPGDLWHGYRAEEFGLDEDIRLRTRKVFLETEMFIITLGLSEVWYDEQTGGVFWRAVPKDKYVPGRHKFRVSSFAETLANLQRMFALIRTHVPGAKVMFTLSPVPLAATFRPVACLTANSVSKAILRAAMDEFYREHWDLMNRELFYFPSYEVVAHLFPDSFDEDNRHPKMSIVNFIMKLFEVSYCKSPLTYGDVNALYQETLAWVRRTLAPVRPPE